MGGNAAEAGAPAPTALAALAALPAERVGVRFKGLPPDAADLTLAELAAQRRDLFTGGFGGAVLTLDDRAVAHNVAALAGWCAARGASLAPHGKTTMAPQLWARQLAAGAWGITVANVAQARVARAFGVGTVVIANEVADSAGLAWIGGELARDPACRFVVWVDSVAAVELADSALAAGGGSRPLAVCVEVGATGGRAGCRDLPGAVAVAEAVARSPWLRLVGVAGYEGVLPAEQVTPFLRTMAAAAADLDRRQLLAGTEGTEGTDGAGGTGDAGGEILLSAGGSVHFDAVARELAAVRLSAPTRLVLRSGCYVTHDDVLYAKETPAARGVADAPRFRPALRLWAQVLSRPEPGLALLGFGRRDVGVDAGLPVAQLVRRRRGAAAEPLSGVTVEKLNDQHAFCALPGGTPLEVGDWVGLGISHPCTVLDRWQLVTVVADGVAVDFVRTFF